MATSQTIDGRLAYEWVCSVANVLFWQDDALWTGKDIEYGDPSWMEWRSGLVVDSLMECARQFVPAYVYEALEVWDGEDE